MSYKYVNEKTIFPSFFQYPEFLLNLPISQTGKTTYMLLYDRARLSQKNNWIDENGRVYVIFPIKELAKKLEKSETTVKMALNELDEVGLLQRKPGGFSKPNHIFLKIMTNVEISESGENQTVGGSNNCLSYGKKRDCDKASSPTPNKVIEKSEYSQNNGVRNRTAFGIYKNVFLSQEEYEELCQDYPGQVERFLTEISTYMEATGKVYRNHAAAIRNWATKDKQWDNKVEKQIPDYSYEEGDSL